jgi:hypothetical protein
MGLFDFLFGSKQQSSVQILDDRIWKTQNAKLSGIKQQIRQKSDSVAVLLVAHFEETLQQLRSITAGDNTETPVQLILAEDLESDTARLNPEANSVIDLIVAERHPLKSADDALLLIAEGTAMSMPSGISSVTGRSIVQTLPQWIAQKSSGATRDERG